MIYLCHTLERSGEVTESVADEDSKAMNIAGQLMQNPQVLAALQGRLEGMIGTRSGYIEKYYFLNIHVLFSVFYLMT